MSAASKRWPLWLRLPLWLLGLAVLWLVVTLAIVAYTLMEDQGPRAGWTIKYRTWLYYMTEGESPNMDLLPPAETLDSFELYPGYTANLYASEVDFPIGAPVAINFDDRGRLWLANSPTYPHLLPGELPNDSIVILEDTDRDGVADTHTVFADDLYLPMGFALVDGGAIIVQAPDVILAVDDDDDGVMDRKQVLLSGYGTADSHHVISALEWGPDGALYMPDGWFLFSQVETPWGPQRLHDGGVWRYEPDTQKLDIVVSYNFANPWGQVFDDWGQSVLCDASGGENYYLGHLMAPGIYPDLEKPESIDPKLPFLKRGRPTAGCDIVSSANFAAQDQGRFMVNQSIGFHGVRWNHFRDAVDGSGYEMIETGADLLQSGDAAFRPVAMEFGPDGALYVLDFYSPVIGHMQFSVRDERRDKTHGRIWRITRDDGPTDWQPDFHRADVAQLLEHLKSDWAPWRFHARRRLQQMDAQQVLPAVDAWLAGLDRSDPRYTHQRLEGLWVHAGQRSYPRPLLLSLLKDDDYRARAAAARLYRFAGGVGMDDAQVIRTMVEDVHPRVRLEGILNAGQMMSAEGAGLALLAAEQPMDYGMEYALTRTLKALAPFGEPVLPVGAVGSETLLMKAHTTEYLLAMEPTEAVYAEAIKRRDLSSAQASELLAQTAATLGQPAPTLALATLAEDLPVATAGVLARVVVRASLEYLSSNRASLLPLRQSPRIVLRHVGYAVSLQLGEDARHLQQQLGVDETLAVATLLPPEETTGSLQFLAEAVASGRLAASIEAQRLALTLVSSAASELVSAGIASYDRGAYLYRELCGNCHQPNGEGIAGAFPPLAASDWLLADTDRAIKVVLHGLKGPVTVNGQTYSSFMAPLAAVADDLAVADVLTYVLNSWGNNGGVVLPAQVSVVREQVGQRSHPWTSEELVR